MPKTPTERKAAQRERQRAAGLRDYLYTLTPAEHAELQRKLARMRKREASHNKNLDVTSHARA